PVDYGLRKKLLHGNSRSLEDGGAKLHVIRKGLELRKKYPGLFHGGKYMPLYADGGREENILAFSLSAGPRSVIAIAPRLFTHLMQPDDNAPLGSGVWGDAQIACEGEYLNVLTGE